MADNETDVKNVDAATSDQGGEEVVEQKVEGEGEETQVTEPDFSKVEPEVRKRPIDYIEERKARRAERQDPVERETVRDEEEGDEDLTPQARKLLERKVREQLAPIVSTIAKDYNDREINEVVALKPDMKKYVPLVRKYMEAEGWQGVPAKRIFDMLDYEHAGERGADEARRQTANAKKARGGESARASATKGGQLTAEDIAKLTPEQALNLQKRLAMGESISTQK